MDGNETFCTTFPRARNIYIHVDINRGDEEWLEDVLSAHTIQIFTFYLLRSTSTFRTTSSQRPVLDGLLLQVEPHEGLDDLSLGMLWELTQLGTELEQTSHPSPRLFGQGRLLLGPSLTTTEELKQLLSQAS